MALRNSVNARDYPEPSNSSREEAEDNNETFNTTDQRCSSPSVQAQNTSSSNEGKSTASGSNNRARSSEGNPYVLLLRKVVEKGRSYGVKLSRAAKSRLEHLGLLLRPRPTTSRHSQIAQSSEGNARDDVNTASNETESAPEVPTSSSDNTVGERVSENQPYTNKTKKRRAPMPPTIFPSESNTDDFQDSTEQR